MDKLRRNIKRLIIKLLPDSIIRQITDQHSERSSANVYYSQEGEDILLQRFLDYKQSGFYIDIGAHHPTRYSNTYLFYLAGWRGINIDAMPGSMTLFKRIRSRDINLEIPVSGHRQELTYYIFNEPALNTFSSIEATKKNGLREYKVIRQINLETLPLSEILRLYLPSGTEIDFFSIDVEGMDFEVLKSNDWDKFRPTFVLIESLNNSMEEIRNNEIFIYLTNLNYQFVAKTLNTLFFKKN